MRAQLPLNFALGDQICRIHNFESLKGAKQTALAIVPAMPPERFFNNEVFEKTKQSEFVHRHFRFPLQRLELESIQISVCTGTEESSWPSVESHLERIGK